MKKIGIMITIVLLLSGCGGEESKSTHVKSSDTNNTVAPLAQDFAYETQGSVSISLIAPLPNTIKQAQVLLYESQNLISTPVGDTLIFDDLIIEGTIIDNNYTTAVTLGKHINSIWILIPVLAYEKEHVITDNAIDINLTQGQ